MIPISSLSLNWPTVMSAIDVSVHTDLKTLSECLWKHMNRPYKYGKCILVSAEKNALHIQLLTRFEHLSQSTFLIICWKWLIHFFITRKQMLSAIIIQNYAVWHHSLEGWQIKLKHNKVSCFKMCQLSVSRLGVPYITLVSRYLSHFIYLSKRRTIQSGSN